MPIVIVEQGPPIEEPRTSPFQCLAGDIIFLLMFLGLTLWSFVSRRTTTNPKLSLINFLTASIGIQALATFVCLIHDILLLKPVDADARYIPLAVREAFGAISCTLLVWVLLGMVLDKMDASAMGIGSKKRVFRVVHYVVVGLVGVVGVVDVAMASYYVHCRIAGGRAMAENPMAHWGASMVAMQSLHIFVSLHALALSALLYRTSKTRRTLLLLLLTSFFLLLRSLALLLACAVPILEKDREAAMLNKMGFATFLENAPLVLVFGTLVMVAKGDPPQEEAWKGQGQHGEAPFRGGVVEGYRGVDMEKMPVLPGAAQMGRV